MQIKPFHPEKIIKNFLYVLLLTPLVYFPWLWRPAQASKTMFFVTLLVGIFISSIVVFKHSKFLKAIRHPIIVSFGIYVLFVVIASFFGTDFYNSFLGNDIRVGGWLLLVCFWFFSLLLVTFFDRSSWKIAEDIFIYSGALIALYACLEVLGIVPSLGEALPRAVSIMGNPIYLAGYLILPFTISLLKIRSVKTDSVVSIITSVIIFLGIVSAGTRGAFLGLVVGAIVAALYYIQQKENWKKYYASLVVVAFVLITMFVIAQNIFPANSYYGRFFHFSDGNVSNRLEYWKIAMNGVFQHPIMGVGFENFYRIAEQNYSPSLYRGDGVFSDKPHNFLIEILVCSGWVGLGLYLGILYFVFFAIYKAIKNNKISPLYASILIFGFVAHLVQNLFVFDTITTYFTFSFFLAFVASFGIDDLENRQILVSYRKPQFIKVFFVIFFMVFCWFAFRFIVPTYQYFSLLAQANDELKENKRYEILEKITLLPFVYDRTPLAKLYQNSAKQLYNKIGKSDLVNRYLIASINQYKSITSLHPNRGEYWYLKADAGLTYAFMADQKIDDETRYAIKKAIELSPDRTEPYIVLATQLEMEGKINEAIDLLEEIKIRIPFSNKLLMTLSVLYSKNDDIEKSAEYGFQAIDQGLKVAGIQNIIDLATYFANRKEYSKVIILYKRGLRIFPREVDLYANLAAAYAADGQKDKAIEAARMHQQLKPSDAAMAEQFIQSLGVIE